MKRNTGLLAAAAASLFLAGTPALAADEASEGKVKCEGVNECKGHSACKGLFSECAGKNSCKGKGFVMLTPEECEQAKAALDEDENSDS